MASQVPGLMILERCGCRDDFCATFYTKPKPDGGYGPGHRNVNLYSITGLSAEGCLAPGRMEQQIEAVHDAHDEDGRILHRRDRTTFTVIHCYC